jgi:site-specific recombinase XerD
MELLGHSQISTTANIYGHVFADALREAADTMDRALGSGM